MSLDTKTIALVAGARPNFGKIAPLYHILCPDPKYRVVIVHTGQHYDPEMSQYFFEDLKIPQPDYNLEVGGGTREYHLSEIHKRITKVFKKEDPDVVVVVGDVNSTLAAAQAASDAGITVAHVEAGIRSHDLDMPEERNRLATDPISDILLTSEPSGGVNLLNEGHEKSKIHFVGNIMIDAFELSREKFNESKKTEKLGLDKDNFIVSTIHRASNVDTKEALEYIIKVWEHAAIKMKVVIPLHHRTRNSLEKFNLRERLDQNENIMVLPPLRYISMIRLMMDAKCEITDSGAHQDEMAYMQKPCLTVRDNTERPITAEVGSNTLVHHDFDLFKTKLQEILDGKYKKGEIPVLWDGKTAGRIKNVFDRTL